MSHAVPLAQYAHLRRSFVYPHRCTLAGGSDNNNNNDNNDNNNNNNNSRCTLAGGQF